MLLSENIQAAFWSGHEPNGAADRFVQPNPLMESRIGMVWHPTLQPNDAQKINGRKDEDTVAPSPDFVRPSSNHSGGVNATMADGSAKFLSDEMDYLVYILVMTPNGKMAADPATKPKAAPRQRPLHQRRTEHAAQRRDVQLGALTNPARSAQRTLPVGSAVRTKLSLNGRATRRRAPRSP